MKNPRDPRHVRRVELMQKIFSRTFGNSHKPQRAPDIELNLQHIDGLIAKAAPEWPLDKISKIDLSVLRLATFELAVERKEPPKVIIDEAIELAKEYGNEHSAQFVNGVLGTILKSV